MKIPLFLNHAVKKVLPPKILNRFIDFYSLRTIPKKGLTIKKYDQFFDIFSADGDCIRISRGHNIYLAGILDSFEYYFSAVKPIELDGQRLVDYSTPRFHEVIGYELHPIMFPSLAEPIVTANQYVEFAELKEGSRVLDLGAYSGLTSIVFDRLVAPSGLVVAMDADSVNYKCMVKNFDCYQRITGRRIVSLEGAAWEHNEGIMFSTEGNMGSSAVTYVGNYRGRIKQVKTYTLNTIVSKFGLEKIDFIKCDIEGAESVIFKDSEFFRKNRPRIIIEPHRIDGKLTVGACTEQLSPFGYKFKEIKQHGFHLPLLECYTS